MRDTGRNPRLGDYTNTLDYYTLTPHLKCKMNAMALHLESWHYALDLKETNYIQNLKKWRCRRSVQLLNIVDVENDWFPPQEGIAFTTRTLANTSNLLLTSGRKGTCNSRKEPEAGEPRTMETDEMDTASLLPLGQSGWRTDNMTWRWACWKVLNV
jgi:hypothetical protein